MRGLVTRFIHRLQTAWELFAWMGARRPWLAPMVGCLLGLTALVMLAQASQISPLIYTLF